MTDKTRDEYDMEQLVGRLLQVGVLIAAVVVLIGGAMLIARQGNAVADYHAFTGEPPMLRGLMGIFRGAAAGDAGAIVQLGLVLLIATPVARVALTLVAFVKQRDRLYVGVTAIVLALLLYGLLFGRA